MKNFNYEDKEDVQHLTMKAKRTVCTQYLPDVPTCSNRFLIYGSNPAVYGAAFFNRSVSKYALISLNKRRVSG